ncbi:glycoside hydrolase [Hortaea werneckii]|nr:glycoside hydrolase [Hortaea werneckii]
MPQSSREPRESPARRQRRRRAHHRVDSNGDFPERSPRHAEGHERYPDSPSPTKARPRRHPEERRRSSRRGDPETEYSRSTATAPLSAGQLAQLDKLNRKLGWEEHAAGPERGQARQDDQDTRAEYDADRERERAERRLDRERRRQEHLERKRRRREEDRGGAAGYDSSELVYDRPRSKGRRRSRDRRVASGQQLERGRHDYYSEKEEWRDNVRMRGGGGSSESDYEEAARKKKRKRKILIGIGAVLLILAIAIPVGVVVGGNGSGDDDNSDSTPNPVSSQPANSNLNGVSEKDIPEAYQDTSFDPFSWYDTKDFNVTFTPELVGGLSIMGLNDTWDDDTRANDNVKPLKEKWNYGTDKIRGVNLGGWLSIEPLITPSLFDGYTTSDNVIDEWTLSDRLGPPRAKRTIEQHYSKWVSESTFADIQAAGFDHVRIPFSYWAVITYDGDPYVPNASWRYLLRGIEWARKYGLRINLDLHGAPGSQNGWNHSGRQGNIGWLNGTDGDLNGDRTIAIHQQLSAFFAQPRYKNIVTMYGLVNEPRMVELDVPRVLTWTRNAIDTIRSNNYGGIIIFGDGFRGLDNWQGELQNYDNLLLDVHQYVIFNTQQIQLNHHDKIQFACSGWTSQALRSQDKSTGFGPTLCGEWSQADTDCAKYLNNVGVGSRWEGTLNMASTPGGSSDGSVLTPTCPTQNSPRCSCEEANADPSSYSSEYKQWLKMFAEAQMHSFEQGWGWFYWTWKTESAVQWNYQAGMSAGILPSKAFERDFNCGGGEEIPMFNETGLPEYY